MITILKLIDDFDEACAEMGWRATEGTQEQITRAQNRHKLARAALVAAIETGAKLQEAIDRTVLKAAIDKMKETQ